MSDDQRPDRDMVHIGGVLKGFLPLDMPRVPTPKPPKKTKAGSKKPNAKLVKAAAEIARQPDKEKRAHISREFVQCSMPHRDPGKTEAWVRRNGNFTLMIEPGFDPKTKRSLGVPFGENAKLLAIWLETEAINQGQCIKFGRSFNEFLRACGCNPDTGGGKRSAAKSMKNQMQRFFNARFSFQFSEVYAEQKLETRFNMNVARKVQYWWDLKSPEQGSFFDSEIILDEEFYKAITANPVSIDLREVIALKNSLKHSAFALDLYIWAKHRLYRMEQAGQREVAISLEALRQQFGGEYGRLLDFKKALIAMLVQVKEVIKTLDYRIENNTFILILQRGNRRLSKAEGKIPQLPSSDQVSETAVEEFRRTFPGWDVYAIIAEFYQWRIDKKEHSGNTDRHFMSYARTWIGRNR